MKNIKNFNIYEIYYFFGHKLCSVRSSLHRMLNTSIEHQYLVSPKELRISKNTLDRPAKISTTAKIDTKMSPPIQTTTIA